MMVLNCRQQFVHARLLHLFVCLGSGMVIAPTVLAQAEKQAPAEVEFDLKNRADFTVTRVEPPGPPQDRAKMIAAIAPAVRPLPEGITSFKDCDVCPEMVVVPPMVEQAQNITAKNLLSKKTKIQSINQKPALKVSKFAIGRYEITWGQYLQSHIEGACPAPERLTKNGMTPLKITATMFDDIAYKFHSLQAVNCYTEWLAKKTGRVYRLPLGTEWEYTARAGANTKYPWGDAIGYNNAYTAEYYDPQKYRSSKDSNDSRGSMFLAHHVGKFTSNNWGLHDIIGNAIEITNDKNLIPPLSCYSANGIKPCVAYKLRGGGSGFMKRDDRPHDVPKNLSQHEYLFFWPSGALNYPFGARLVRELEQ
jgi:formylglycine-generating enzyme required for sulfatase activity